MACTQGLLATYKYGTHIMMQTGHLGKYMQQKYTKNLHARMQARHESVSEGWCEKQPSTKPSALLEPHHHQARETPDASKGSAAKTRRCKPRDASRMQRAGTLAEGEQSKPGEYGRHRLEQSVLACRYRIHTTQSDTHAPMCGGILGRAESRDTH